MQTILSFEGELLDRNTPPEALWSALCSGRQSLFLKRDCYVVGAGRPDLALSSLERRALEQCAGGVLYKEVAFALEVSPSQLSRLLRDAALKLGVRSALDAVRLVGGLRGGRRVELQSLTLAERAVFELVKRGLTNGDVAALRQTSTRTVANQVASVLAKTGLPSRRAVVTSQVSSALETSAALGRLEGSSSSN
jgi:DNA-binding CsgD family transcriptional regulator